jgi:hypothetical protein
MTYPNIIRAMNCGFAWIERDGDYRNLMGMLPEGYVISLGSANTAAELQRIEEYLTENPHPENW